MHKFWESPRITYPAPQSTRVPESLQVANVRIEPGTILAPMAGVTDTVFRRFIRNASFVQKPETIMSAPSESALAVPVQERSGCGLLMTEFTSADGLFRTRESKRKRYLHFYE